MIKEFPPEQKVVHSFETVVLYGAFMEKTTFLNDFSEVRTGVNQNQLQAVEMILETIREYDERGEGVIINILGGMFSGKTTVVCLVADSLGEDDFRVYKHKLDYSRTGGKLVSNPGEVWTEAGLYESVKDLDNTRRILVIDEFQFNTADSADQISQFLMERKKRGDYTIVSQLDFNYRRDPWRTTKIILPLSDRFLVLRAQCEGCGAPAEFPQRNVDGKPANIDDPEIVVGAEELYQAKCWRCHEVGGKEPSHPPLFGP